MTDPTREEFETISATARNEMHVKSEAITQVMHQCLPSIWEGSSAEELEDMARSSVKSRFSEMPRSDCDHAIAWPQYIHDHGAMLQNWLPRPEIPFEHLDCLLPCVDAVLLFLYLRQAHGWQPQNMFAFGYETADVLDLTYRQLEAAERTLRQRKLIKWLQLVRNGSRYQFLV